MRLKQGIFIGIAAGIHFLLAALCVAGDTPAPGDYRDYLPILTMFLLAPLLSGGIALLIAGYCKFWRGRRRFQLPLTLLCTLLLANLFVYTSLNEPFMWLYPSMLLCVAIQYLFSLFVLCCVRWLFDAMEPKSPAPDESSSVA